MSTPAIKPASSTIGGGTGGGGGNWKSVRVAPTINTSLPPTSGVGSGGMGSGAPPGHLLPSFSNGHMTGANTPHYPAPTGGGAFPFSPAAGPMMATGGQPQQTSSRFPFPHSNSNGHFPTTNYSNSPNPTSGSAMNPMMMTGGGVPSTPKGPPGYPAMYQTMQSPPAIAPGKSPMSPFSTTSGQTMSTGNSAAVPPTMKKDLTLPKLNIVQDLSQQPTPIRVSNTLPTRDFNQPAHRFPPPTQPTTSQLNLQSFTSLTNAPPISHAVSMGGRKVDSKSEAKGLGGFGSSGNLKSTTNAMPVYVGSTFQHLPNANRAVSNQPLPQRPTLPKTVTALTSTDFQDTNGLLHNRSADGKILGNPVKRFVPENNVPYYDASALEIHDEPVGPDNPYVVMNDTWTKCWDDEAGAVYYYNNASGEATWIRPEI